MFKSPLFYLIMAPKRRSGDAGRSDLPKGGREGPPLSEKVTVFDFTRTEKDLMLRLLRSVGRTNLSVKL